MKKLHIWSLLFLLAPCANVFAQFVNKGVNIATSENALLYVNTKFIHKSGEIKHKGELVVKGDWDNRSSGQVFTPNSTGSVTFNSAFAELKGTGVTLFPNLAFKGNGIFQVHAKVKVNHSLDLDNAEVQLLSNEALTLVSPSANALKRARGFINTKSDIESSFIRYVNSKESYLYPMGSSKLDIMRFVSITPNDASQNKIGVSFFDHDPSQDGYSRLIKETSIDDINQNYYHRIKRFAGNSTFDAKIHTDINETTSGLVAWTTGNIWNRVASVISYNHPSMVAEFYKAYDYKSVNLPLGLTLPVAFANVRAIEPLTFYNAFSPDGDGQNDKWEIKDIDNYPENDLKIFDRSGNLVYSVVGYSSSKYWDGQDLASGTYIYVLSVKIGGELKNYRGTITMIKN